MIFFEKTTSVIICLSVYLPTNKLDQKKSRSTISTGIHNKAYGTPILKVRHSPEIRAGFFRNRIAYFS